MLSRSDFFPFQNAAVEKAKKAGGRLAFLQEPGYGKTPTVATVLYDLGAWPALVVAPPRVATQVWPALVKEWEHLRHLTITPIAGKGGKLRRETEDWDKQRFKMVLTDEVEKLDRDSHIETISYENLFWLSEHVDLRKRYKAIVFDELSKMKTPGSVRFRRMRGRAMDIPVRLGMTGSPLGNHHLDLWGEMFMVADEKPLGPSFAGYRDRYFQSMDYMQRRWELKHSPNCPRYDDEAKACACALARECEKEIARRVAPYTYVLPEQVEQQVKVPKWVPNIVRATMPESAARNCRELERELWTLLESGVELEALSASAVAVKLRQLASGAVYTGLGVIAADQGTGDVPEPLFEEVHTAKLDAVDEILDELQGQPALVFYWFQHEHQRLKKRLERAGRKWATGASPENIRRWNEGQLEVLLLHPQSAGHGLNLQHGGHTAICTTAPWSWELVDQMLRRLARIGQKAPLVTGHFILCGDVDERVLPRVFAKAEAERRLFADLRAA